MDIIRIDSSSSYHNRKLILEILDRLEKQDSFLNILLPSFFSKYNPKKKDKALMQEICYGVTRFKKRLDWIISQFLSHKKKAIPLTIKNILRMGVYQILYLEKIPDFAIVNESVELTKHSPYPVYSGMVNAILRNIIRKNNTICWPSIEQDPVQYISVFYSFPEWLVNRWINRFGLEMCLLICQASNLKPALTLRINTLKVNMQQFQRQLSELGISFQESAYLPDRALMISNFDEIFNSSLFLEGLFSIQDESSMLASEFLAPRSGETIIDLCSGPGGKTTHIAQLMHNKGRIIAWEKNKRRLEMVKAESRRLGIEIVYPVLTDSCTIHNEYLNKADKVLLDVPCSGTGVIRKKPDLKWKKWDINHLNELNKIQEELLNTAAQYLKPGGELLYTTCSMEKEENEDIIIKFIRKHRNFSIQESTSFISQRGLVNYKSEIAQAIQLIPGYSGNNIDGFYMIKMRKNS